MRSGLPARETARMQEAFFNAWRALHRYETRAAFTSWLHRIAVNVVLAKCRKSSLPAGPTLEPEQLEASEWSLDTPVEEREIEAAIEALPEGARNVLMLSVSCRGQVVRCRVEEQARIVCSTHATKSAWERFIRNTSLERPPWQLRDTRGKCIRTAT